MKITIVLLITFIVSCLGAPKINLAASTGSGSYIYLASCAGSYYRCGDSGSINVDIKCSLIEDFDSLDDNDIGGILQLKDGKDACDDMIGDDNDYYIVTLYGNHNTILVEYIRLDASLNGAAMNTFCNKLEDGCDENKVYGRDKNRECSTSGWETFHKFGQLKLESNAENSRCATYFLEGKSEYPNEALVRGGFHCGNTCPEMELSLVSFSFSPSNSF